MSWIPHPYSRSMGKSLILVFWLIISPYRHNISARQCRNSLTRISVHDYRTKIDTQPMTIICYDYVDTKLIINVYRLILIDLCCQIVNQFSNRNGLINRLSEQTAEDGTHLYHIGTLLFVGSFSWRTFFHKYLKL